jgi:uncharacterized protein (TIGR02246 family)
MNRTSLALIGMVFAGCQSLPSPEVEKSEAQAATEAWVAAFNSCDAGKVVALYHPEAVLWGTVAPSIISTPAGIRQYFERVCSASPQPKVALGEQLVRVFGETAINSGHYTFTVFPGGQPRQFPARYSFTYRKTDGRWLIADHHSSALPAPPQPASAPTR